VIANAEAEVSMWTGLWIAAAAAKGLDVTVKLPDAQETVHLRFAHEELDGKAVRTFKDKEGKSWEAAVDALSWNRGQVIATLTLSGPRGVVSRPTLMFTEDEPAKIVIGRRDDVLELTMTALLDVSECAPFRVPTGETLALPGGWSPIGGDCSTVMACRTYLDAPFTLPVWTTKSPSLTQ